MLHLLSANYLFNGRLGPFTSTLAWVFLACLIGMVVFSVLFKAWTRKKDIFWQKSAKKLSPLAWTMGIFGLLLWLIRQMNTMFISAPILLLVWFVVLVVWGASVLRYLFVKAPKRRAQLMSEQSKKNYLP